MKWSQHSISTQHRSVKVRKIGKEVTNHSREKSRKEVLGTSSGLQSGHGTSVSWKLSSLPTEPLIASTWNVDPHLSAGEVRSSSEDP